MQQPLYTFQRILVDLVQSCNIRQRNYLTSLQLQHIFRVNKIITVKTNIKEFLSSLNEFEYDKWQNH